MKTLAFIYRWCKRDYQLEKEFCCTLVKNDSLLDYLRNFTKFTGKHLYQSFFFNKVAGVRPATLLHRTPLEASHKFCWLMLPRILVVYLKVKKLFYVVYISMAAIVIWRCTFVLTGVSWIESVSWIIAQEDHQSFKVAKPIQSALIWRFDLILQLRKLNFSTSF